MLDIEDLNTDHTYVRSGEVVSVTYVDEDVFHLMLKLNYRSVKQPTANK